MQNKNKKKKDKLEADHTGFPYSLQKKEIHITKKHINRRRFPSHLRDDRTVGKFIPDRINQEYNDDSDKI